MIKSIRISINPFNFDQIDPQLIVQLCRQIVGEMFSFFVSKKHLGRVGPIQRLVLEKSLNRIHFLLSKLKVITSNFCDSDEKLIMIESFFMIVFTNNTVRSRYDNREISKIYYIKEAKQMRKIPFEHLHQLVFDLLNN